MEEEDSSYFGKGFYLCKKQRLHFPNLDIDDMQINPDLGNRDEDAEVNEDETAIQDATP